MSFTLEDKFILFFSTIKKESLNYTAMVLKFIFLTHFKKYSKFGKNLSQ